MSLAATIKAMAATGCSAEQIAAVAEAHEAEVEEAAAAKRAKSAARKARWRANNVHACPRDRRGRDGTEGDSTPSPKERSPTPPKEITPSLSSSLRSDDTRENPKSILGEVLPIEVAADVVAHRKALKSPLTAGSARGLARNFAAYRDPLAAAQAMMANGWKGFKPEWMASAPPRAGPNGRRQPTMAEMARMDEPGFSFDDERSDQGHSTPESTGDPDAGGRGFVGAISFEDRDRHGRHKLVDHEG